MRSFSHLGQTYKLLAHQGDDYETSDDEARPYSNWLKAVNEPIFHPLKDADVSAIEEALINDLPINLEQVITSIVNRNVEKLNKNSPLVAGYWRATSAGGQRAGRSVHANQIGVLHSEDSQPRRTMEPAEFILHSEHLGAWFSRIRKINDRTQAAYVQCLLLTGARPHELIRLRWADLDFDEQSMVINSGVWSERKIPLTPYLCSLLFELGDANSIDSVGQPATDGQLSLGELSTESRKVFSSIQTKDGGIRLSLKAYEKALVSAGLSALNLSGLRGSFVAFCNRIKVPPDIIQQITGNTNTGSVEHYAGDRSLSLLRAWHNKIERWILVQANIEDIEIPENISDRPGVECGSRYDSVGMCETQPSNTNPLQLAEMDQLILTLYARGLSSHEIVVAFREVYDLDVSVTLISKVTDQVTEQMVTWQSRPLHAIYPIVYFDYIELKIHDGSRVVNKPVYVAFGATTQGYKEVLGFWMSEERGAPFWISAFRELKDRGLQEILITCADGLKGFSAAIEAEYPQTRLQVGIFHMVRSSLEYVLSKDCQAVTNDLKRICQATTEDQALAQLELFGRKWDVRYPHISKSWTTRWPNLRALFAGPSEIRQSIYTTNVMRSLSRAIRSVVQHREIFPSYKSAKEVIYLLIEQELKKRIVPIRNWNLVRSSLDVEFGDLLAPYSSE